MSGNHLLKLSRMIAGLSVVLLSAALTIPLGAQTAPDSRGLGFGPAYDRAHETTLNGTIQEVVTHVTGGPAGMHLLVAGPQGIVDAHVGPFLSKKTIGSLQTGMIVQIVGATLSCNGKEYLLARELTVGGATVKVRSEHGLLVRADSSRSVRSKSESQVELDGGTR